MTGRRLCLLLGLLFAAAARADEIGEALQASQQALKAARESQQRIDRLAGETRRLQDQQREAEWKARQLAGYAAQLEREAEAEETRRAGLDAQLTRISGTGQELVPLMERMLGELEQWVERDLPFLHAARRKRVAELRALVQDPERSIAVKFGRVLEAYRSEVEYGHSLGAEEAEVDCAGALEPAWLVRVGRVGLYCLSADRQRAGYWDTASRRWRALEEGAVEDVGRALDVARGASPPELLVLPVRVPRSGP